MAQSSSLVSVKEYDYLDQDPPLRGQNFVCLSFVSPEEVIKRKDVFLFERYLESFSKEVNECFANLAVKYPEDVQLLDGVKERYQSLFKPESIQEDFNFFLTNNSESLEKEYHEKNNFQTTIRGIKVRGCFESLREAEIRAQVLRKMDNKFHVFVAEVGCWCPWSPNPDDIANQEYAETQLNTLMKGYKENQEKRDAFYNERKTELQTKYKSEASTSLVDDTTNEQSEEVKEDKLQCDDPWMQKKVNEANADDEEYENIGIQNFE